MVDLKAKFEYLYQKAILNLFVLIYLWALAVKNISKVAAYIETVFYLKVHPQLFSSTIIFIYFENKQGVCLLLVAGS